MRFVPALACGLLPIALLATAARAADTGRSAPAANPWVIGSAGTFALPRLWTMTLSLAAGCFLNGDDIGANEHLEFQSGIAFARQLPNGVRLGLAGYHISNGGLEHPNNGTEALAIFVAVPVRTGR